MKQRETLFLEPEVRDRIRNVWVKKYMDKKISKSAMLAKWVEDKLKKEE
jgi:hypothetical protein